MGTVNKILDRMSYALRTLLSGAALLLALAACQGPVDHIVPPPDQPDDKPGDQTEKPDEKPKDTGPAAHRPDGYYVVGYAVYWEDAIPDPSLLTHINYSFAHIKPDFESLDIKNESRLQKIAALKKTKPTLNVLLSVGGWGAGNFSEMAADETHRKRFCDNCLAAVKKYGLDGIDLDWEYPTSSSAGISSSSADTRNFTLLVKQLRETLGEGKLLTMASSASAKYVDFKSTAPYFDYINLMTYDMGKPPYHNAALYRSSKTKRSCEESVTLHKNAGVPYEKMCLGIAFFGHGDGAAFSSDGTDYNEITYDPSKYFPCWDDAAKVPYLCDEGGAMVFSYDDPASVGLKADYVRSAGLLGAMYWNIEADDSQWTLSREISSRLLGVGGTDPSTDPEAVLATNPYVEDFLEKVTYPERDYSASRITEFPGGGPGEADIPPVHKITWQGDASAGSLKATLWQGTWTRTWNLTPGASSLDVTNLVPGVRYNYIVSSSSGRVVARGAFDTKGMLHQVYFTPNARNARDLGGWKTDSGKRMAFRKLYRGGRIDGRYMDADGKKEFRAEGIKAELDLREAEDVPKSSPVGSDIAFCAPGFDGGYRSMVRDRRPGVKECFEFVVRCLREDKPVYFHCAAGRDRTGTLAVVLLGVLGVSEGDISKDYELTYFAPSDWSMYTSKDPDNFYHMRTQEYGLKAACNYLWDSGGSGTFKERVEKYLLSLGVAQDDIDDFRRLMLE